MSNPEKTTDKPKKEKVEKTPEQKKTESLEKMNGTLVLLKTALSFDKAGKEYDRDAMLRFAGKITYEFANAKLETKELTQAQFNKIKEWGKLGTERKAKGEGGEALPYRWKWFKAEEKTPVYNALVALEADVAELEKKHEAGLKLIYDFSVENDEGKVGRNFNTYFARDVKYEKKVAEPVK